MEDIEDILRLEFSEPAVLYGVRQEVLTVKTAIHVAKQVLRLNPVQVVKVQF